MGNDIDKLDRYIPWWREMDSDRQAVFVILVGKIGVDRFMALDKMLAAASVGAYDIAGAYLRDSGWYFNKDGSTDDLSRMLAEGFKGCQKRSNVA